MVTQDDSMPSGQPDYIIKIGDDIKLKRGVLVVLSIKYTWFFIKLDSYTQLCDGRRI